MIAAPQAVDQFGNADALVAAGVARRVDSEVAERVAAIRHELREEGGLRRAVELVEAGLAPSFEGGQR